MLASSYASYSRHATLSSMAAACTMHIAAPVDMQHSMSLFVTELAVVVQCSKSTAYGSTVSCTALATIATVGLPLRWEGNHVAKMALDMVTSNVLTFPISSAKMCTEGFSAPLPEGGPLFDELCSWAEGTTAAVPGTAPAAMHCQPYMFVSA